MVHDRAGWQERAVRAARLLMLAALPLACFGIATVHAQNMMRTPNLNVGSTRIPSITPSIAVRIHPEIAGGATLDRATPRITTGCSSYAFRDSDGRCRNQPLADGDGGGDGTSGKIRKSGPRRSNVTALTGLNMTPIVNELVAEIDSSLTDAQADQLARRHGMIRLDSLNSSLLGGRTIGLFRITDRRAADVVSREFATDSSVVSVQRNFRYFLQDQKAVPAEGDPAQYALGKLRLPEAHTLAHGTNVVVAVIDSGIDVSHPELANTIAASFDALGSSEGPHVHGTGIAGVIAAHARLMGSAPAARILAIRAFGTAANGAESNSFVILKGLDYAVAHGAQVINMSFAGPKDLLIERGIAATAAKGIVMVAASGNAGPKSPPLYPAANPNVIAVSATDAQDKLFAASNRGGHIAVAAPGVDIFVPVPGGQYEMKSGTSFSAAYVSGVVALVLERNPSLRPEDVRTVLTKTARDLGAPGRDDLFGSGETDAFAAVSAVASASAVPVAAIPAPPATEKLTDRLNAPATRDLTEPGATMASEKPANGARAQ